MLNREILPIFKSLMTQYPIVTIMGPRQSGKTTFVTSLCPEKMYVNLENPDTRELIGADIRHFLSQYPEGLILDEIQRMPELLSYLQTRVDANQAVGQYVLTGSHQFQLQEAVNQSLAGRTALLDLLPLSIDELANNQVVLNLDTYLYNGFYPAIYSKRLEPTTLYRSYVKTYVERDVRQLVNIKDLRSFQLFVQLLASRVGALLNLESLGNDCGVSGVTIKNWLSILEASYLLYRLPPYFENFGKRFIKSPKLYFCDVGLVSYLLGFENEAQITRDRLRGNLFENLVVMELIKQRSNQGKEPMLYFHRDNHGNEVDVIIKNRNYLIPIEIKSTTTFNKALFKNLHYYKDLVEDRIPFGILVYAGEIEQQVGNFHVINFRNLHKIEELIKNLP